MEIFGTFGKVQSVEIPGGSGLSFTFRHCCFVEFEETAEANKALKYMDGGQIDGQEVMVTMVKPTRGGPRRHKFDHENRRRGASPRRGSPRRGGSPRRSPARKRRGSVGSSSDSD